MMNQTNSKKAGPQRPKAASLQCIAIVMYALFMTVFAYHATAQNGGDSITAVNCPGADTVLAAMVVSENSIIHYITNREN